MGRINRSLELVCWNCGEPYTRSPSLAIGSKYCSKLCASLYKTKRRLKHRREHIELPTKQKRVYDRLIIKPDAIEYRDAIRRITVEAFSSSELGHNGEAELIDLLRSRCKQMLSLVALRGEPVGHILFTPVSIHSGHGQLQGMGLGPLSVLPNYQGQGIGSQLIVSGLDRLRARDIPFIAVVGHPDYYTRFGFEPASEFGITHGFQGLPQSLLFIYPVDHTKLRSLNTGTALYRPEFGTQDDSAQR
jgi:putative acetyltransferase